MARKRNNLYHFQLAVHGWSFAGLDGMITRLASGEAELAKVKDQLRPEELKGAEAVLAGIRLAIRHTNK